MRTLLILLVPFILGLWHEVKAIRIEEKGKETYSVILLLFENQELRCGNRVVAPGKGSWQKDRQTELPT